MEFRLFWRAVIHKLRKRYNAPPLPVTLDDPEAPAQLPGVALGRVRRQQLALGAVELVDLFQARPLGDLPVDEFLDDALAFGRGGPDRILDPDDVRRPRGVVVRMLPRSRT